MDNITHSIIGLASAEALLALKPSYRKFYRPILVTALAANSFPDIDFFYSALTQTESGEAIGKLLHHRGHTHTLIFSLPGAALIAYGMLLLSKLKYFHRLTAPFFPLFTTALVGLVLHVFADSWNNYGVHPFWPFWNRWFYGDSLFILEPMLWAIGLPFVYFRFNGKFWRSLVFVLLGGILFLMFRFEAAAWYSIFLWMIGLAGAFALWRNYFRNNPRKETPWLITAILIAVFVFRSTSAYMDIRIKNDLRTVFATQVHDVSLTPFPANPFCWTVTSVETDSAQNYIARRFNAALLPALIRVEHCPNGLNRGQGSARLEAIQSPAATQLAETGKVQWIGSRSLSLEKLRSFYDHNCEFAAVMKFYRIPFIEQTGARTWLVGDLRYDRSAAKDFPEMEIQDPPGRCPRFIPGWKAPRADLLN